MRPRISIWGFVRPSVGPWVRRSVGPSVRNPLTKNAILARKLKETSGKYQGNIRELSLQENSRKFSYLLDASLFGSNLLFKKCSRHQVRFSVVLYKIFFGTRYASPALCNLISFFLISIIIYRSTCLCHPDRPLFGPLTKPLTVLPASHSLEALGRFIVFLN